MSLMSQVLQQYRNYMSQDTEVVSATQMAKSIIGIARKNGFEALKIQQSLRMHVINKRGANSHLTLKGVSNA